MQVEKPHRITRVQADIADLKLDAILLMDMRNIRYLTGFTGSDGFLIISGTEALLMVDGRYVTQAKRESSLTEIYEYRDKTTAIVAMLKDRNLKAVGFEAETMTVDIYRKIYDQLEHLTLTAITDYLNAMRSIKTDGEISYIKTAAAIASESLKAIEAMLKPGVRETDIALELEYKMRGNGAQCISFPTIVASGPNSALPHASPGNRRLKNGDILVIDYGAVYNGYHSDETWTCIIGQSDSKQEKVYNLVKEAHDRALTELKNGARAKDVDSAARSFIDRGGYGEFFSHGTGHGVGLDVHESPRIAATSDIVLKTGMVVTIEPGVYLPDFWGIRIEDMALIKNDGCEILTNTPKDLRVLG